MHGGYIVRTTEGCY